MGFFDTNPWTAANFNKLGPFVDEIVGTNGNYQDLYAAVNAGARKIIVTDGAIISANTTIPSGSGFIVGFGVARTMITGAYRLLIQGSGTWHLANFGLTGATGTGLEITATGNIELNSMAIESASSHGCHLNTTRNDILVTGCYFNSNGGDGLWIASGASTARVFGNMCWNNGGYGINDSSSSMIEGNNRLDNNTSGARNPATSPGSTYDGASKTT